jgi:glyoxylase-like metal-dependent hydrolase (beta-lactamase superfamily II)
VTSKPQQANTLDYPFAAPGFAAPLRIADGVEWIRLPLPFPPKHVNVYRLDAGADTFLVDTGYNEDDTSAAWKSVGLPPAPRVVVTHFHPDHLGQAARLEDSGAEIHLAGQELAKARALVALSGEEVQASLTAFFAAHALPLPEGGLGRGNGYRRAVPTLPCRALPLTAGVLPFATGWTVRFAGGHSPAHALVVRDGDPVVAAGDILLPQISPNISVWPDAPDADPLGDYLASLEALKDLPADTLVLPAHGLPYRGIHERIAALAAHHADRLDLVRGIAARRSIAAADVVPRMFSPDLSASNLPFALGETIAHLNRLWHAGEFDRTRGRDGVYRYGVLKRAA